MPYQVRTYGAEVEYPQRLSAPRRAEARTRKQNLAFCLVDHGEREQPPASNHATREQSLFQLHTAYLPQVRQRPETQSSRPYPPVMRRSPCGPKSKHGRIAIGRTRQDQRRPAILREEQDLPIADRPARREPPAVGAQATIVHLALVPKAEFLPDLRRRQEAGHGASPQTLEGELPRLRRVGKLQALACVSQRRRGVGIQVQAAQGQKLARLGAESLGYRSLARCLALPP